MAGYSLGPKCGLGKIQDVLWYPHTPVREDRQLHTVVVPKKLIRRYTDRDLRQVGHSVRDRLEKQLQDTKHDNRFEQSVTKVKKFRKLRKQTEDEMRLCDVEYDPDLDKKVEWSLKQLKKSIRGKSADVIKSILLKDALEDKSTQETMMESQQSHHLRASRRQVHVTMMDERDTRKLEESFSEPLSRLRGELHGFNRKESHYLENKRFLSLTTKP